MQTILIVLNPGELANPDLDLRYRIPDRIAELTNDGIRDNGYDYIDTEENKPGPLMGIWLETEDAGENWPAVLNILQMEKFEGNNLSKSAKIYISDHEADDIENCVLVYPQ